MKPETLIMHPLTWTKDHPPTTCSKCGKEVKPGRLLGCEEALPYCYRCGTSRFFKFWKKRFNKMPRRERDIQ